MRNAQLANRLAGYWHALAAQVRLRLRGVRHNGQRWLRSHPRLRKLLRVTGCLEAHPPGIARGVAIGVLAGLTPIIGFQTIAIVLTCTLLRANFIAAFIVSWISNPFTVAPLYWGYHQLGETIFSRLQLFGPTQPYMQGIGDELIFAALGSAVVAIPCTVISYFLAYRIAQRLALRHQQQRDSQSAE